MQKQGMKTGQGSKRHRDDPNEGSARSQSVGAKDEEAYDKFYHFEADDDEALSVDNSLRLQQAENVPQKDHGELDFKNLTQTNAEYGNP